MKRPDISFILCVFLMTATIAAMFGFGRNVLVIMWPTIIDRFAISYATIGTLVAVHQGAYLLASSVAGRLAVAVRPAALIAAATTAAGGLILLVGFVEHYVALLAAYGLLGALIAFAWVPMVRYCAQMMTRTQTVAALSTAACGTALGFLINGFVVPPLLERTGFAALWSILGIVTASIGGLIYVVLVSFAQRPAAGAPDRPRPLAAPAGPGPAFPKTTFCAVLFLCGLGLVSFQTYYSAYLVDDLGVTRSDAATAWIAPGLLGLFSGLFLTFFANRWSIRRTILTSLLVLGVVVVMLPIWNDPDVARLSSLIYGLIYFGLFGLFPAYLANTVSEDRASRIFGRANLFLGLGSVAGGIIGGNIAHQLGTFGAFWILAGASALVAFALTLRLPSDHAAAVDGVSAPR